MTTWNHSHLPVPSVVKLFSNLLSNNHTIVFFSNLLQTKHTDRHNRVDLPEDDTYEKTIITIKTQQPRLELDIR